MRSILALSLVLLATVASVTSSSFTIALRKTRHTPSGDIRARAELSGSRGVTIPLTNKATYYAASVGIGSPATYYNLVVDTGSSNTFVGVQSPYIRTTTSISTGENVSVIFGPGLNMSGAEYLDRVTLAPNLTITNQSIGDTTSSIGLGSYGFDGVLGLGPIDLTNGTLSPDANATVPTVMNNLLSQGLIKKQAFGVYFAPAVNDSDRNGFLTFGDADPSLYEGELTYVPVTKTFPSSLYWGLNITRFVYGDRTILSRSTAGIIIISSPTFIATELFDIYKSEIPGASYNATTTLLEIPATSIPHMKPLHFHIGKKVFTMDVAAQLIPQAQNTAWGGEPGKHYSFISDLGGNGAPGLSFMLGIDFVESYYTVFDADVHRIGFAKRKHIYPVTSTE